MITDQPFPIDGRVVHILANDGADLAGVNALKDAVLAAGAAPHVVATHKGAIADGSDASLEVTVDRSFHTASSAECDALVVAGGSNLAGDPAVRTYIQTAYRHLKTVAAWGDGSDALTGAGVGTDEPGVVLADTATAAFADALLRGMSKHRHWERLAVHPTRAITGETNA
jgi:catalase